MKTPMYAVRDSKAECFLVPFASIDETSAVRSFEQQTKDPRSSICMHAADFTLHHIGNFDVLTGKMDTTKQKELCSALDLQKNLTPQFIRECQSLSDIMVKMQLSIQKLEEKNELSNEPQL